ncbi:tetratricopeptide repeat protein [Winogradskyella eckloniae]|uniref:tetratricopeptide repeat-containing sensor histidine kinase n=1 Tax=Winogradskyella eckloniae TaxID=1089306 RepID=UPI001566C8AB|nr:tetratricopeptide repeat protein [Winogradskyella eckloniae]NRD19832.1 tetratricopeptide repeat protein [Winogradskyella eckloniae]
MQFVNGQVKNDSLKYYSQLALKPQRPDDLDKAFNYFQNHYENAAQNNKLSFVLNDLYYISSIHYKKGAYEASEDKALEAIKILDANLDYEKNTQLRKSFYTLLGLLYYEQRNQAKCLELYDRVLEITDNARDSAIVYNNISNIYRRDKNLIQAKAHLLKAYKVLPRLTDTLAIARILDNLGFVYSLLNESSKDLPLMQSALELREAKKDTTSLYTSYSHLAEYYYKVDSLDKSLKNALKAQEFANHINSPIYRHDALGMLTKLSKDSHAKAYKILNDSITNADKERASKDAFLKYDNSEFKRKALESQLKEEQQKTRTIIAVIAGAFITLVSIFIYFLLKSKHRKEKIQQVYDTESRISKQIHDEVANDVFQFMTKLESESLSNSHLIDDLQDIYSKTRDISKEHGSTEGDDLFEDVIKDLVLSFSNASTSVLAKGNADIDWESFSKMKRTTIYKVLQELLINMKKHSHASIAVLAFKNEGKKIVLNYSDNGVGCNLNKSTGLQNVENRIESLNGTITFETEPHKGFKTQIII